ncbi:MAG: hypothetical protein U5K69_18050 [Balneolaceae bacterium]|nr:hypothetical protein [Balneolaceae bacterium]
MTTSVIDYIFRELAVTYLGRDDLAHVPAEEILTRKLRPSEQKEAEEKDPTKRRQMKQQPEPESEPVGDSSSPQARKKAPTETEGDDYESDYERAKQLGYTGDSCTECGSMTMIRNGTCQKCITCGATTGCS